MAVMAILQRAVVALLAAVVASDATAPETDNLIRQRASSSSSCSGEITVNSQADVDSGPIASCTSIDGDIIFDNATGNITFPVELDDQQLRSIEGSVYCRNNTGLEGLKLYGVTSISGSIIVENAASLQYLAAEQLETVQSVSVTGVPSLQFLELPLPAWLDSLEVGGSPMNAENFREGLSRLETIGELYIHNCANLSIPRLALQNITRSLRVEDNGPDFDIFLDIQWAYNITMRGVKSFSLDSMVAVNDSIEISSCDGLTEIGFNDLKSVGGDFYVANNPSLTYLGIPSATSIGGDWLGTPAPSVGGTFTSQNNPALQYMTFSNLQTSVGMYLDGPWPSLDSINASFPALTITPGGIVLVFSGEAGAGQGPPIQCNWEEDHAPQTWSSAFSCNGTLPGTSQGLSLGAKVGIGVGVGLVGAAILAAVVVLVLFRRKRVKRLERAPAQEWVPEMDGGTAQVAAPTELETKETQPFGLQ